MIREGGTVAPRPLPIRLSENDVHVCWKESLKRNKYRRYSESKDAWKQGFAKNPAFFGNIGEAAFSFWLQRLMLFTLGVDFTLRPAGDRGVDFIIFGRSYQIKSIGNPNQLNKKIAYVRHSDRGRSYPLEAQIYVFFDVSDLLMPKALGFIAVRRMANIPIEPSPVPTATHCNYVIPFSELENMATLVQQIELDRRKERVVSLSGV